MHLHKLEGAWLSHPFWKTRFVLNDPADLLRLRDSGVPEVLDRRCRWAWTWPSLSRPAANRAAAGPDGDAELANAASRAAAPAAAAQPARRARSGAPRSASAAAPPSMRCSPKRAWASAVDAERCLPLVDEIAAVGVAQPGRAGQPGAAEDQDDYSYMHSVAVCALMVALARQLGWTTTSAARPAWPVCCTTWARR